MPAADADLEWRQKAQLPQRPCAASSAASTARRGVVLVGDRRAKGGVQVAALVADRQLEQRAS